MPITISICSTCDFPGATFLSAVPTVTLSDSSQVDSLDLQDYIPNKGVWALGQTPINVPTLKQLLDIYPNKSDVAFVAEGFEFGSTVTSHIKWVVIRCLVNDVFLMACAFIRS